MSKASNVHPGHYKIAGRGRQGEGLLQQEQKQAYADQRETARRVGAEEQAGIPAWEATPPNLEAQVEPEAPPAKPRKRKKKTSTRKAAPKRAGRRMSRKPRASKSPKRAVQRAK